MNWEYDIGRRGDEDSQLPHGASKRSDCYHIAVGFGNGTNAPLLNRLGLRDMLHHYEVGDEWSTLGELIDLNERGRSFLIMVPERMRDT